MESPSRIEEEEEAVPAIPAGRILNAIFNAKPKQLRALILQLNQNSGAGRIPSKDALSEAIASLLSLPDNGVDQIVASLMEHALNDRTSCRKIAILLRWLCRRPAVAHNFEQLLSTNSDRRVILGWCAVARELIGISIKDSNGGDFYFYSDVQRFLQLVWRSIPSLLSLADRHERVQKDGFVLPTRLSVAAADCILVCTQALVRVQSPSEANKSNSSASDSRKHGTRPLIIPVDSSEALSSRDENGEGFVLDGRMLLWDRLDCLIILLEKLEMWSRKSRPLHCKGLRRVIKSLQGMKDCRDSAAAGTENMDEVRTAASCLCACWKHYSRLIILEDSNFHSMFNEYLSELVLALNHFSFGDEDPERRQSNLETRSFFLTCVGLLIGRLDSDGLQSAIAESGSALISLLFLQLKDSDEDVTDLALNILREIIFRSSALTSENPQSGFVEMEMVTPLLMDLLDERDSAARAVVVFVAECFARNPDAASIQKLFECLDSKNRLARRNAIDVIAELMDICSHSGHTVTESFSQNIAKHLLDRLGDEELTNRVQASTLFAQLDLSFVMPALVQLVFSRDVRIQSSATEAIVAVLKSHSDICSAVAVFLDCVRNSLQNACVPQHPGQISEMISSHKLPDVDLIMRLVPKWSPAVQNWEPLVEMLLGKMFSETSNSVIPRFLSEISNHLADVADTVFRLILLNMQNQKHISENLLKVSSDDKQSKEKDESAIAVVLFARLSPLLVLRVLPLRAFDNFQSRDLYGSGTDNDLKEGSCIADILVETMSLSSEFEDVRKLAAEIAGKLHPQIMVPMVTNQMESAFLDRDPKRLKTCLFAICNSLMLWGKQSFLVPEIAKVRRLMTTILSWVSFESEEVVKVQHGCIDCLAFMICAELQFSNSKMEEDQTRNHESKLVEEIARENGRMLACRNSEVLAAIFQLLMGKPQMNLFRISNEPFQSQKLELGESSLHEVHSTAVGNDLKAVPLSFRLCMANVLISVCQKISLNHQSLNRRVSVSSFTKFVVPSLMDVFKASNDSQIRAACLQVLFAVVYHLKSTVLPYAMDLFNLSIGVLRTKGSTDEHIAGAKLMASLMASDDEIISAFTPNLMDAKKALFASSFMNESAELRSLCEKLLECMSSPINSS